MINEKLKQILIELGFQECAYDKDTNPDLLYIKLPVFMLNIRCVYNKESFHKKLDDYIKMITEIRDNFLDTYIRYREKLSGSAGDINGNKNIMSS